MIEGKSVLITGGAGFIGSSLAETFVDQNNVILVDSDFDTQPLRYSEKAEHPNLTLAQADVLDFKSLAPLVSKADIVIHLAAIVGVSRVRRYVRDTMNVTYNGTLHVLQAAEEAGRCERFVYFSTSEIFGVNSFRAKEDSSVWLAHAHDERWCYAISKLAAEYLVRSSFKETGLPTTILRPFNVFGLKRTGDHAMVRFIVRALLNRPLEVYGDGTQVRSWCYIDDLCQAVRLAVSRPEAIGEDFNIGNPKNTLSIYQLAKRVIEICQSKSTITFLEQTFPDVDVRAPWIEKARTKLGFEPHFELDEALRLTIEWYRMHLGDFTVLYG